MSLLDKQTFTSGQGSIAVHFGQMQKRHPEWKRRNIVRYEYAIARLRESFGRDVSMDELTPEAIGDFSGWCKRSGVAVEVVRKVRYIVEDWQKAMGMLSPVASTASGVADPNELTSILELYRIHRRIKPNSLALMQMTVDDFADWLRHPATLADLTDDTVSAFITFAETRWAQATAAAMRTRILCVWRFAAKRGLCEPIGDVRRCPPPEPFPVAWQLEEVRRLIAACDDITGTTSGVPVGSKLKANILFAYETGLRRGDLWRLNRRQVRDDGVVMLVQHKTQRRHYPKVRESTRDLFLSLPGDCPLRWAGGGNFYRAFGRLRDLAELSSGSLHQLRRTGATHVAKEHGMDAARVFLGHRSPEMVTHYVDESIALRPSYLPPSLES